MLGEANAIFIKFDTNKFVASRLDNNGNIIKGDNCGDTMDAPERTGNTLSQKTGINVYIIKGKPATCKKCVMAQSRISIF